MPDTHFVIKIPRRRYLIGEKTKAQRGYRIFPELLSHYEIDQCILLILPHCTVLSVPPSLGVVEVVGCVSF